MFRQRQEALEKGKQGTMLQKKQETAAEIEAMSTGEPFYLTEKPCTGR